MLKQTKTWCEDEGQFDRTQPATTNLQWLLSEILYDNLPQLYVIIGYQFIKNSPKPIYNSTILMFFLRRFCSHKTLLEDLIDLNLKTDLAWVRRLTASHPQETEAFVDQLTLYNETAYDSRYLVDKFNLIQFLNRSYYPIAFFYLGLLTLQDYFYLRLPNLNLRQIFVEYFNELHHIDVSTRYAEMMQQFINQPNLEDLFSGYWREYISQLPETIFQQVNKNFGQSINRPTCIVQLSHE